MDDMDKREQMLRQDGFLLGIVGASLLNGMHFSPFYDPGVILLRPLLASFYITSPIITFYLASLVLALATLIVAGIPAALFERLTGRTQSDGTSLSIWLAATLLLALPSFLGLIGAR